MSVNTSTVTSAGNNGNVTINPNGSGKVVLSKNAGSGNEVVGVNNSGHVERFRVSGLGAKTAAVDADLFLLEESNGVKKKITLADLKALISGGGAVSGGLLQFQGSWQGTLVGPTWNGEYTIPTGLSSLTLMGPVFVRGLTDPAGAPVGQSSSEVLIMFPPVVSGQATRGGSGTIFNFTFASGEIKLKTIVGHKVINQGNAIFHL